MPEAPALEGLFGNNLGMGLAHCDVHDRTVLALWHFNGTESQLYSTAASGAWQTKAPAYGVRARRELQCAARRVDVEAHPRGTLARAAGPDGLDPGLPAS